MNDDVRLALRGIDSLKAATRLIDVTAQVSRVQAYTCDPYLLMRSMYVFRGASQRLVFLDMPRASKRAKASLVVSDEQRGAVWTDVAYEDLDYRLRLRANCLICSKLALDCLSLDGLLLAIATPDTYMAVRGAIEHWMGPDKFLGEIVYQVRRGGGNDADTLSIEHESLLIFTRSPESFPGLKITKTEQELKKYNEKDGKGAYYWDTYIRKQARQYYPIKCPDGSVLEKDEFGNLISWLWSEETFKKKLTEGEVKFGRAPGGSWRLYYKDRIKSEKVVRSIARPEYQLDQVVEGGSKVKAEDVFLTQKGSREILGYTGEKPDYLKSSEFYGFIIDVFAREGSTFFPFNENGSGVVAGFSPSRQSVGLVVGGVNYSKDFVDWRVSKAGADARDFSYSQGEVVDLLGMVQEESPTISRILKSLCADITSWHDVRVESALLQVGIGQNTVVIIDEISSDKPRLELLDVLKERGLLHGQLTRVLSAFSTKVVSGLVHLPPEVRVEQYPMNLMK